MVFCFRDFSVKYKTRTHTNSTFHTARSQLTQTSRVSDLADKPISSSNLRVFTVAELETATDNFCRSSRIGEGGFGKVYKGVVKSLDYPFHDIPVAVKYGVGLLQGKKEWSTEIEFLGRVKHPNLVKLIGYGEEKGEVGTKLFLVYEYMPNRSLRDQLSSRSKAPLSWAMRLKVAHDAACGLTYLHEDMNFQIILRDFKSSNILLDDQWNAKLSDFGVARLGPSEGITHISTNFAGTRAYAAPEYLAVGHLTSKSDVWSYGVFLHELITGRHPLDTILPREVQIVDPRLEGKYSSKAAEKLSYIASLCLVEDPKSRPKMSEVLEMVSKLVKAPPQVITPASPGALVVPENEVLDPTLGERIHNDTSHEGEIRSIDRESAYVPRSRRLRFLKSCFR